MEASKLKNDLECTCDEFVDGLFSGKMGACTIRQTKFLLWGQSSARPRW